MEGLKEKQSKSYLEEAELSLETAQIVFEKAKEEDKDLWANLQCCITGAFLLSRRGAC